MAKYTFLLPAYKGRFLNEMLQSIQSQTYKDFKVIISDDCSPEDLYSICVPYLNDSRFKYRRNEKNMGGDNLVSHWNMLVDMCDTEYCIMAGDDDVYDENFLFEVDILEKEYQNVDVIRTRVRRIDDLGESLQLDSMYEEYRNQHEFLYDFYTSAHIYCIGNYVFRTSCLQGVGCFVDFPYAWFSDDATVIICGKNGVVNTKNILFNFRSSSINISSVHDKKNSIKKIEGTCCFYEWIKKNYEKKYETKLLTHQTDMTLRGIKNYVYNMICALYTNLPMRSFLKLLMWMEKNNMFQFKSTKLIFIKNWFLN